MECIVAEVGCASVHVAEPPALSKSKAARVERPALFVRECRLLIPSWPPLRLSIPRTCGRALEVVPVMNREMKALRAGSMAAASCPANISVAGATVDLPPDQWKLLADDKHPFTARLFDFVACVIVQRFLEKEVQEHIRVVTSDVVADIVADRDEAVKAFAGVMECSLVAFCIWTEDLVDNNCSNASMLLMLHPDHLSIDGDENWHTRFVRVAIPPGGREHVTAAEAIVEWFQGRVDEEFARGSIQCTRARQLQDPNRLYDMDATSLKGSCGNLACLFALDKTLAQLDAVAANGSGPQFSRPTAKTLNALRHDAHQTAEELAFNLSVDLPRHKHGGEAEGAELGKMHEVTTGARVADHGVLALTGAAGVSSRGGARGGTAVHADDDGADDTATKGAPREDADRTVAREGEESSEEEAEAHVVAAAAANRPATSGKSIKHLAQHLAPGAGSAAPSGEVAGKSPVTCARDHASLSALPSHRLAAEILQLDCRLAAQAEEIARLKIRQESGVGGVAVVGSEELAAALSNAVRLLEREARALAQERAALLDTRNQEALVLGRVDARLGQLQGVVADSMETAQKKLTDEVARKIDNMSSAVSTTAERAITTSGVTNALHTLIALVGGSPTPRTCTEDPAATENADAGDAEHDDENYLSNSLSALNEGEEEDNERVRGTRTDLEVPIADWNRLGVDDTPVAKKEVCMGILYGVSEATLKKYRGWAREYKLFMAHELPKLDANRFGEEAALENANPDEIGAALEQDMGADWKMAKGDEQWFHGPETNPWRLRKYVTFLANETVAQADRMATLKRPDKTLKKRRQCSPAMLMGRLKALNMLIKLDGAIFRKPVLNLLRDFAVCRIWVRVQVRDQYKRFIA
ncbi:unnamed protein product [Closterium sp. Yama58-4]|nr:unnamed protein product [Closterium sp. Yama58-4]